MRKVNLLTISIAGLLGVASVIAQAKTTPNECNNFEFSIHNTQNHAIKGTYELPADGALNGKPTKGAFTVAAKQTKKITTVINGGSGHNDTWVAFEIYDKGISIFKGSVVKKLANWVDNNVVGPKTDIDHDYQYIEPAGEITLNSENLSAVKEELNDKGYCSMQYDTSEEMLEKIKMGSYTLKV